MIYLFFVYACVNIHVIKSIMHLGFNKTLDKFYKNVTDSTVCQNIGSKLLSNCIICNIKIHQVVKSQAELYTIPKACPVPKREPRAIDLVSITPRLPLSRAYAQDPQASQ